jgi:hypothetical protein
VGSFARGSSQPRYRERDGDGEADDGIEFIEQSMHTVTMAPPEPQSLMNECDFRQHARRRRLSTLAQFCSRP